jgi:RAQPRD family integrative conjugative element protein
MRLLPSLTLLTLSLVTLPLPVAAQGYPSPAAEREHLARLLHEIETLGPLIDEAERHADPDARIRFQYHWLRQDLDRVSQGIREHLQAPRAEPRQVPPLRGDYRR